jgi:hypothetical protein
MFAPKAAPHPDVRRHAKDHLLEAVGEIELRHVDPVFLGHLDENPDGERPPAITAARPRRFGFQRVRTPS